MKGYITGDDPKQFYGGTCKGSIQSICKIVGGFFDIYGAEYGVDVIVKVVKQLLLNLVLYTYDPGECVFCEVEFVRSGLNVELDNNIVIINGELRSSRMSRSSSRTLRSKSYSAIEYLVNPNDSIPITPEIVCFSQNLLSVQSLLWGLYYRMLNSRDEVVFNADGMTFIDKDAFRWMSSLFVNNVSAQFCDIIGLKYKIEDVTKMVSVSCTLDEDDDPSIEDCAMMGISDTAPCVMIPSICRIQSIPCDSFTK